MTAAPGDSQADSQADSQDEAAELAAREWSRARDRVVDLVRGADAATWSTPVPATPAWSVHDLLAHVIGLDADTLAGQEADDHNPTWTQAQVDRRVDHSPDDLLGEWDALADDLVAYIRDQDTRPLGDLLIHEQDLRGALGRPGARDTAGWAAIRERIAGRLADPIRSAGLAPLRLESSAWTWSSEDAPSGGAAATVLRADAFDLARAVMSRRTATQLRSWVVAGDIEPYLEILAGMGPLPTEALPE